MAKMKLGVGVIEGHSNGDEGITYIGVKLDMPKGMGYDAKAEWLSRQADILNAFIKEALLDAGYEIKENNHG